MPTIAENYDRWSNYEWDEGGDEWSVGYGGTEAMWSWTILPRIAAFLPSAHTLEIAPGFGRVTQYLVPASTRLTVVDLADNCIEACKNRFADYGHIDYYTNDGKSLGMIADSSIDFVFSWDSFVHAEDEVMETYVMQLASKLRPGGSGVFHHSNMHHYWDSATGGLTIDNEHWRATSMSAAKFRRFCRAAGLRCVGQELVPWGNGTHFTDCISMFRRDSRLRAHLRTKVVHNDRFFEQVQGGAAAEIRKVTKMYRCAG